MGLPRFTTRLNIYFKRVEETIVEEYVLVDFFDILAAVGGSMGLFLGFSFFDFGVGIKDWMNAKKQNELMIE